VGWRKEEKSRRRKDGEMDKEKKKKTSVSFSIWTQSEPMNARYPDDLTQSRITHRECVGKSG
jgi:hypothetical protein